MKVRLNLLNCHLGGWGLKTVNINDLIRDIYMDLEVG